MDIETSLQRYVAQNILFSDNGFAYSDDASFLEEGIVDSTGVLELVLFVEESYGLTVADQEITRDNFDSINRLAAYVRRKLAAVENR